MDFKSNIFNVIIHMLYKYGQILFVIPKYNNISSEFTNLSVLCNVGDILGSWEKMITKTNKIK